MGYYVDWFVSQRCVRVYSYGLVTIEDITAGAEVVKSYLKQANSPVHLIADMRHMQAFPTNLIEIVRATDVFKSPKWGWLVVISNDQTVRFLATAATQMWGARYQGLTNINAALVFLQSVDPTLSTMPEYVVPEISTTG